MDSIYIYIYMQKAGILIAQFTSGLSVHTKILLKPPYHKSRGTKVGDMLTLAPERYTAGLFMVAKVIP